VLELVLTWKNGRQQAAEKIFGDELLGGKRYRKINNPQLGGNS
jgi:hypothetical protein